MRYSRREMLRATAAGAAALTLGQAAAPRAVAQQPAPGPFTLPPLPYAANALVPHISERIMQIHHDRHHLAYVNGLNTALQGQAELARMPIETILRNIMRVPEAQRQAVINHGGGHYNHTLFWNIMGPNAGGEPAGMLGQALTTTFESFAMFKTRLTAAAMTRFGSGWAWLVVGEGGRLEILSTANQDCPLMQNKTPILGIDVWEHAYYLQYENLRASYVTAWWNVVNWGNVGMRYMQARG